MCGLRCLQIDQIYLEQLRWLLFEAHLLKDLEEGAYCKVLLAVIETGLNLGPLLGVLEDYLQSVFLWDHWRRQNGYCLLGHHCGRAED